MFIFFLVLVSLFAIAESCDPVAIPNDQSILPDATVRYDKVTALVEVELVQEYFDTQITIGLENSDVNDRCYFDSFDEATHAGWTENVYQEGNKCLRKIQASIPVSEWVDCSGVNRYVYPEDVVFDGYDSRWIFTVTGERESIASYVQEVQDVAKIELTIMVQKSLEVDCSFSVEYPLENMFMGVTKTYPKENLVEFFVEVQFALPNGQFFQGYDFDPLDVFYPIQPGAIAYMTNKRVLDNIVLWDWTLQIFHGVCDGFARQDFEMNFGVTHLDTVKDPFVVTINTFMNDMCDREYKFPVTCGIDCGEHEGKFVLSDRMEISILVDNDFKNVDWLDLRYLFFIKPDSTVLVGWLVEEGFITDFGADMEVSFQSFENGMSAHLDIGVTFNEDLLFYHDLWDENPTGTIALAAFVDIHFEGMRKSLEIVEEVSMKRSDLTSDDLELFECAAGMNALTQRGAKVESMTEKDRVGLIVGLVSAGTITTVFVCLLGVCLCISVTYFCMVWAKKRMGKGKKPVENENEVEMKTKAYLECENDKVMV